MDSSALKTSPHPSRVLAVSVFVAGVLIACGSGDDSLREWTCTRSDISPDYEFRTGGNANSDEIGQLGSVFADSPTDTYFSYWKQTVGDPPFETPAEILCQVTRFDDEIAAGAYVDALSAENRLQGLSTFAWLADDYTVAERIFIAPVEARVFEIRVDDELRIIVAVQVVDRYVQSVLQGTSTGPPATDISIDITQALRARTELLLGLEDE